MKREWIECEACEEEFRVVSDSIAVVIYCPFCGSEITEDDEPEEEE